jgi:DNA-binding MarR family transcriptional regulator
VDTPEPAEPHWLDADQQRAWRAYLTATTLLMDRLDDEMREAHGVAMVEYEILVRLSEAGGQMRMAVLADSLAHSRSRVTHTIARMEKADLVERCEATVDRRGVIARMTEHGWAVTRAVAPTHVTGVRELLVDVATPEDFAAFGRVMGAVADHLVRDHPERDIRAGQPGQS